MDGCAGPMIYLEELGSKSLVWGSHAAPFRRIQSSKRCRSSKMRARNLQATEGERSNIGGTGEYRALELGTHGIWNQRLKVCSE